jgi:hypothetical protein
MAEKMAISDSDWKQKLTPEQYHVTREAGTEPAFTGRYWKTKDAGTYHCVCCGEPRPVVRNAALILGTYLKMALPRPGCVIA